jgi:Mg2+ and Co2+ transporter CorA
VHKYTKHIIDSLDNAEKNISKINNKILDMEGMSGKQTRHFYNNICSMEDSRYLEIGTWKGSSVCSAMFENEMTCVCIDNWSEFGGPKQEFLLAFSSNKGNNDARFIEKNCWDVDTKELGMFNIYMYDGNHTENSHYEAINHFKNCLDNEFIYLVDDWNWLDVKNGTLRSIRENNLSIIFHKEILTTEHINRGWHNGIGIFVLKKDRS